MLRSSLSWMNRFVLGAPAIALAGVASAYAPPAGFEKFGQPFAGSAVAIAPDGKVAVGYDNFFGNASIKIYSSLATVGQSPLATITQPTMQFVAGVEFLDNNTIVFGDNGSLDTVLRAVIPASPATVAPTTMAPNGSVPNIADLTVKNGLVYATAANGLNAFNQPLNQLVRINNDNSATVAINNFGTGYIGGVTTDSAGNFLITDTNAGVGIVRRFNPDFSVLDTVSLAAGGGWGAVDLAFDSEGDLFVTTGNALTQVDFGGPTPVVSNFGQFGDVPPYGPYPTFLAYHGSAFEPFNGDGKLVVSGFTDELNGGVFVVQTPEPASMLGILSLGFILGARARRRIA